MSAGIALESIPPERNAPTGTSATIREATAVRQCGLESIDHLGVRAAELFLAGFFTASAADQ